MDWLAFAGSILGGLIGGLFTFFGVRLTIKHDEEKRKKEQLKQDIDNKPRLEITKYSDLKDVTKNMTQCHDFSIIILGITDFRMDGQRARFYYNQEALNDEMLQCVDYEFKNTGLTEIIDICATSNLPKNMSIFDKEYYKNYVNENLLCYDGWATKRYIKPGEKIRMRIYYVKNQIVLSNMGNPVVTIWLRDINGKLWSQSLNAPYNEIEISRLRPYSEFKNSTDIELAIECFKNPYMW